MISPEYLWLSAHRTGKVITPVTGGLYLLSHPFRSRCQHECKGVTGDTCSEKQPHKAFDIFANKIPKRLQEYHTGHRYAFIKSNLY